MGLDNHPVVHIAYEDAVAYAQRELAPLLKQIIAATAATASGEYSIDPLGDGEYDVYCDQVTRGGGWTYVARTGTCVTGPLHGMPKSRICPRATSAFARC